MTVAEKKLVTRVRKLEEKVEELTIEVEAMRKHFLQGLSRAVNGPSVPPPPELPPTK